MRNLVLRLMKSIAPASASEREWTIPDGRRVYAIGDIHGRLDLLREITGKIAADDAARGPAATELVFLGDLVDRGPDSCGVIDFLMDYGTSGVECVFLGGNHDEIFVRAAEGKRDAAARLHRMGGRETALSYGITEEEYRHGGFDELASLLASRVPRTHVTFLRSLREWYQVGDYIFVHAGIQPGKPMTEQAGSDLRWIRSGFLDYDYCHGAMIVHGHSITSEPEMRANRIGIDTGAFRSGTLTALGLEGTERWLLSTAS